MGQVKLWTVTLNIKSQNIQLGDDPNMSELFMDTSEDIQIEKIKGTDSDIKELVTNPTVSNSFITFNFPKGATKRILSIKEGLINYIDVEEVFIGKISKAANRILKKYNKKKMDEENESA